VPVDLELTWPAGNPDQIKLTLFDGGVKLDSLVLTTPTCATGATRRCRAVLQGDFATPGSFNTPTRKWLTIEARVTSGATTQIGTDSVEAVLVDRRSTPYGAGWWPAGVVKLVAAGNDRLLIGPSGTAAVYRGVGDSVYVAPPGDFSVLVKTASGWELSPRGSLAKAVFDTSGRLIKTVDQNGNRDSIAYSGATDQVTTLVDPVGKAIAFAYGNGKLSTITDPGSRQTKVSINGTNNQLTYDSISSPSARPATRRFSYQSYPGTNTVVLTTQIGVITDTTIVTYDSTFRRRPTQVRLPQVRDENNTLANPVISYTAYERRGVGALVSLDSVYAQLKDPRNFWTRSLLNRWGEALKTWDSLGVLGKSTYTPDGLPLTTEGKTADSSRVYSTYDALAHLVRRHIVQDATHTLRLDSLVYDANHRVIQRIDPQNRVSQVVYDGLGNVTQTIAPDSAGIRDTTRFWYRSDGLLDSTRAPGETVSRRFSYDATWKNLSQVKDESGIVVEVHAYDGFGRDTAPDTKVRATATPQQWQWRRVQTFYNVANQVDSVREVRTDNCANPCNTPTWPTGLNTDTLHVQRVRHQFDRAGRDSLRINDRLKATEYLYDRLGRVIRRRPWTTATVRDSFAYDLAGNLRKTFTRQGDSITTNYDSRNRDTLSVIPGVGTLRKAYGGPLDQVTRIWYASPVDSIGGVNAEVRAGYDQRGRLKADTSYTGTTARATSYTYDSFERRSTSTDALGTWTARYETDRGFADSLLTPLGDTITYLFDRHGRAVGPYIKSGGNRQTVFPFWNAAGELTALTHNVSAPVVYLPGNWQRGAFVDSSGKALAPVFLDRHGSAAATDTLKDSLQYDGFEHVIFWRNFKNGADWEDATYQYDRLDNIKTPFGAEVYDDATSRLLSWTDGTPTTWTYTYDAAGNLTQAVGGAVTLVYSYDALNQLRALRRNGTLIARYGYDVLGQRIAKRVYASASGGAIAYTRFVYHGGAVAYETDSAGSLGLRYTWGPGADNLIAVRDAAGNHYYVVHDPLGSVRGLVKRDGTWTMSVRYNPYGGVSRRDTSAAGPGVALRYGWTGREYDAELGWYYFRSRYYDPGAKRFVQEDPIGYGGGANLYSYVGGDVMESRDPSGMLARYSASLSDGPRFCFASCWDDLSPQGTAYPSSTGLFPALEALVWQIQAREMRAEQRRVQRELADLKKGSITGLGVTLTVATPYGGFTVTIGSYRVCCSGYEGSFASFGSAGGFEGSFAITLVTSESLGAFRGESNGGCMGFLDVSHCTYSNRNGTTDSWSYGVGIGKFGKWGIPIRGRRLGGPTGQSGTIDTYASDPMPCDWSGCNSPWP
jgi:RHS repeat-associated protein